VDPFPLADRSVTAIAAGLLATICGVSAVVACWVRLRPPILTPLAPDRSRRPAGRELLTALGAVPLVRRVPLSHRTADALTRSGVDRTEGELVAMKVAVSASAALAGLLLGGPLLAAVLGPVGYRAPDIGVGRAARHRLAAADREIPVLLDLLAVATSAGLPAQLAFRRAVDAAEGPLADDLRPVLDATDLGGRWRDELRTVCERLELPDLRRLVGTLGRSESLGSPLSEELARLARDVREARRARATERARAAPVKMLFPLVFLVLPAFLLLTVVPVLVTTVRSIV
jgi:Flp pilus assembly protein TadB